MLGEISETEEGLGKLTDTPKGPWGLQSHHVCGAGVTQGLEYTDTPVRARVRRHHSFLSDLSWLLPGNSQGAQTPKPNIPGLVPTDTKDPSKPTFPKIDSSSCFDVGAGG